jgi:serine/threonine protein kinase
MGIRFDDESCDGDDARPSAIMSFSMMRARKRELLAEQRSAWAEERSAPIEGFLGRWPTDPSRDPDAASLLLEDYLQRRRRGEPESLSDYQERFPEHGRALDGLLAKETVYRSMGRESEGPGFPLRLPEVGDTVFGFHLRRPLGEGAFARVFQAEQADLAGRPVVLKISDIEGAEPQTLAQLLHTNIVPIYSLHEDRRAGLRAVCMPYLGGASLSAVLNRLWADSPRPTTGAQLAAALEAVEAPRPDSFRKASEAPREAEMPREGEAPSEPSPPVGAAEDRASPLAALRAMSYEHAAACIVARLAEGLHHAHQRGILHRDIKPSNILLSAEGQPLLLDFNLAQGGEDDPAHATIGGTVAYMVPEHFRALVGRTPALIRRVDNRSDIYSLGMVLAEMLTGRRPFDQSGSYSALPCRSRRWRSIAARQSPRSAGIGRTSRGAWKASSASAWRPTRPGDTSRPTIWPTTCAGCWKIAR